MSDLEGMHVVLPPCTPVLYKKAPSSDAELAARLVPMATHCFVVSIDPLKRMDLDHQIENWLRLGRRDGGASGVMDGDDERIEDLRNGCCRQLKCLRPPRIMLNNFDNPDFRKSRIRPLIGITYPTSLNEPNDDPGKIVVLPASSKSIS